MNMSGIGLGLTLGTIIYLIVKLLIIILAVVVFLGVVAWIRSNFFKNVNNGFMKNFGTDPILKTVMYITLGIIGLVVLICLINNILNPSVNMGMNNGFGFDNQMGYSPALGIAGILVLLIKVLMFILIISIIMAALVYIKSLCESGRINQFVNSLYKDNENINVAENKTLIIEKNERGAKHE